MLTSATPRRGLAVLAGAVLLLAVTALVCVATIPRHSNAPRYADYLNPNQNQNDHQCSLPVDQRTTGWTCYQP